MLPKELPRGTKVPQEQGMGQAAPSCGARQGRAAAANADPRESTPEISGAVTLALKAAAKTGGAPTTRLAATSETCNERGAAFPDIGRNKSFCGIEGPG